MLTQISGTTSPSINYNLVTHLPSLWQFSRHDAQYMHRYNLSSIASRSMRGNAILVSCNAAGMP